MVVRWYICELKRLIKRLGFISKVIFKRWWGHEMAGCWNERDVYVLYAIAVEMMGWCVMLEFCEEPGKGEIWMLGVIESSCSHKDSWRLNIVCVCVSFFLWYSADTRKSHASVANEIKYDILLIRLYSLLFFLFYFIYKSAIGIWVQYFSKV